MTAHETQEHARLHQPVDDRDHIQGPTTAAITLVEYGDFQCPVCLDAYPIVVELRRRMGNRMRFVFRHFPLTTVHPNAQHAAECAEAAGAQGKFWEMHDRLYENQRRLDDASLLRYIEDLGLDAARAARDLETHAFAERVRSNFHGGVLSGVNGTPTFFVNDFRHDDAWDVETLMAALEEGTPRAQRRGFHA